MPRLTIANLMLGVAGLALILAAFRVHFSLGSLVFGLVTVPAVALNRWIRAERAAGRVVTPRRLAREAVITLWVTVEMMAIVALPAFILVIEWANRRRQWPSLSDAITISIVSPLIGWGLLRLVAVWIGRRRTGANPSEPNSERMRGDSSCGGEDRSGRMDAPARANQSWMPPAAPSPTGSDRSCPHCVSAHELRSAGSLPPSPF